MENQSAMVDWRARDDQFFRFIDKHPGTTRQLVQAEIFPSYKVANRRLVRMKKRTRGRKPRVVGTVAMGQTGREALVYCGWRPRAIKHEVLLTQYLLHFGLPMDQWKRGLETDSKYKPDAECSNLLIEFDTGTEGKRQVQNQMKQQRDSAKPVLWVFHSLSRFDWVKEVANETNTLMTLASSREIYDLKGRYLSVDQLCMKL